MALDVTGTLIKILPEVKGEGKNGVWVKQEFVLETADQYPKKVCLSLWGDKANELKKFALGDNLTASINLESREYNERWFTEARAWRLELAGRNESGSSNQESSYAAPVAAMPKEKIPTTALPDAMQSFSEDDDLPF
jgi:Domain of unknown function (DUF3127)